jgi:putative Mg2+ transporter-C (MgtC) family protein
MNVISYIDFIISLVAAMIAGVVIGIERQMKKKDAGLKTNALVAVGTAIFVNISYRYMGMDNVDIS